MRVAYLVNQYPSVSHTFIRREIHALERQGVQVDRISLRGWELTLVDPQDIAERKLTRYVLQGCAMRLLATAIFPGMPITFSKSRIASRPPRFSARWV